MTGHRSAFALAALVVSALASLGGCSVTANVLSGVDGGNPGGGSDANVSGLPDTATQVGADGSSDGGSAPVGDATSGVEASVRCEAGAGAAVSADAAACSIDLSQYDRTCSVDSDCVSTVELSCAVYQDSRPVSNIYVRGGNFCDGCNCAAGFAINTSAVAQYVADVAGTPQGSGQVAFPVCNCPPTPPPGVTGCNDGFCGLSAGATDAGASE
jgi:hypothetical protein